MNPENEGDLVDKIAQLIQEWGLAVPATFFLELARPLSFIGGQLLHLARPLLGNRAQAYALLLEDRSSIDRIVARLGRQSVEPSSESR